MYSLFKNAKIYTLEKEFPLVEAMITRGDQIIELGDSEELYRKYNDKLTNSIDFQGKTVIPGFNDAHLHLYQYALTKNRVNLKNAKSFNDIKIAVKEYLAKNKLNDTSWIVGQGWNDKDFIDKQIPTKADLDTISTTIPIILKRACYHVAIVNSKALELSAINKNTPDPEGGKIGRNKDGSPNGILYDYAINLVDNNIPTKSIPGVKQILKSGFKEAISLGLTSIQTDDFINVEKPLDIFKAYLQMASESVIPLRINLQLRTPKIEDLLHFSKQGYRTGSGDEILKIGPVKLMADGSLGARTAGLKKPYNDLPSSRGELLYDQEKLNKLVLTAYQHRFQVAIHAIGDAAIEMALNSYKLLSHQQSKKEPRPIIIHAQVGSKSIFNKMRDFKVIAAIQPIFLSTDWSIIESRIGKERSLTSYAWKSMLDNGITITGSSDAPVESLNPLFNIYTAVTRKDLAGNSESGWHQQEQLSTVEAVSLFTSAAAYQSFEENIKGTLTPGKLADFIVLSQDIFSVDPETIKDIKVEQTYVGGKLVYTT